MNKKLSVNDKDFFNKWREQYHLLSSEDQMTLCNELEAKYPFQKAFDKKNIEYIIEKLVSNYRINEAKLNIVEAGGWKGELAHYCFLSTYGNFIKKWVNIEASTNAIDKSVFKNPRYVPFWPVIFNWFTGHNPIGAFIDKENCNLFISCHVIEHLNDRDALDFINAIKVFPYVYLEAPIKEEGSNEWKNYLGTHILKMGWDVIKLAMQSNGFKSIRLSQGCYFFFKGEII